MSPVNKQASGVIITHKDYVLLAKRADLWEGEPFPFAGYWSIFGGAIEKGETKVDCAVREAMEEARITLKKSKVKFIKTLKSDSCDFHIHATEVESLVTLILNEEHTDHSWIHVDDLDSLIDEVKIDISIINIIKYYIKNR